MPQPACQLKGITKAFGANAVLRGIDLELQGGQVTVLMGANGAGKSTLVKVLCGVHAPDSGKVSLFGQPYVPNTPSDAIAKGVVTVHQAVNDGVIPQLDVASNLVLHQLTDSRSGFFVNSRKLYREARDIASAMQLDVDVRTPVEQLGVADRQLIAIARAMARSPKILILDEPTSSLSSKEAERLFDLIDRLRSTGVAILYISHRMSDIRRIADTIISMRDGQIAARFNTRPLDYEAAVTAMLGHGIRDIDVSVATPGPPVLRMAGVRLSGSSAAVDLQLCENEVVVITGLLGSGKTQIASLLFGIEEVQEGSMELDGKPFAPATPGEAMKRGVFHCPKDRASSGVVQAFDITDNLTLPFFRRHSWLSFLRGSSQRDATRSMIELLGVVCQSERDELVTLSGGNQQKVMIGRWLYQQPRVLILDEPFQGVDIQARRDIGNRIRESATGRATLVFVAEIDEALEIADRILVLHEGDIVGEHVNQQVDLNILTAQIGAGRADQPTRVQ